MEGMDGSVEIVRPSPVIAQSINISTLRARESIKVRANMEDKGTIKPRYKGNFHSLQRDIEVLLSLYRGSTASVSSDSGSESQRKLAWVEIRYIIIGVRRKHNK